LAFRARDVPQLADSRNVGKVAISIKKDDGFDLGFVIFVGPFSS
jgi:hypothetical protein